MEPDEDTFDDAPDGEPEIPDRHFDGLPISDEHFERDF